MEYNLPSPQRKNLPNDIECCDSSSTLMENLMLSTKNIKKKKIYIMNGSPMKLKKKIFFSFFVLWNNEEINKNHFHFFLETNRWSWEVQRSRNNTRETPTDIQKCTNQDGIGLGYKPKIRTHNKGNVLVISSMNNKNKFCNKMKEQTMSKFNAN